MKIADLFETDAAKRKLARGKRADRDHEEFLRKRNFSTDVDALKAKIEPKQTITLGGHTPSTTVGTGRPHGKVR